jgi:hypothetical protein
MQTVHQMASAILQRDPTTHDADSIASIVMKFFDQDMREAKAIAAKAADEGATVSAIAAARESISS